MTNPPNTQDRETIPGKRKREFQEDREKAFKVIVETAEKQLSGNVAQDRDALEALDTLKYTLRAFIEEYEREDISANIHRCIRTIRAALQPSDMTSEWQPIETAPRDGRKLIGYSQSAYRHNIREIWWSERGQIFTSGSGGSATLTHWMPLPHPPQDKDLR